MGKPRYPRRPPRKKYPHRINQRIRAERVRVVDEDGQLGVMEVEAALKIARERGLDLVEIAPQADPPVCRLLNYGKFLYEQEKKTKKQRQHRQKPPAQLKMRPSIGEHDYEVKRNHARRFLEKGEKVKLTVQFRGRENTHPELGEQLLRRMAEELADVGAADHPPRREGQFLHLLMVPKTASTKAGA